MSTKELKFEQPTFFQRIKGMLGVDFYRLFHTPLFYIFLGIAAVIPAMILGAGNSASGDPLYTNAWQLVAANSPLYVVNGIGEYALYKHYNPQDNPTIENPVENPDDGGDNSGSENQTTTETLLTSPANESTLVESKMVIANFFICFATLQANS